MHSYMYMHACVCLGLRVRAHECVCMHMYVCVFSLVTTCGTSSCGNFLEKKVWSLAQIPKDPELSQGNHMQKEHVLCLLKTNS